MVKTSTNRCPRCQTPQKDAILCRHCTQTLCGLLAQTATLHNTARQTLERPKSNMPTPRTTSHTTENKDPISPETITTLTTSTHTLINHANDITTNPHKDRPKNATIPAINKWLADHLQQIRTNPNAPNLITDLQIIHMRLRNICDGPIDTVPLGPCPACGLNRHADPRHQTHTCICGHHCQTAEEADARRTLAHEQLITATEATTILNIPAGTINRWIRNRQLKPTLTQRGQPHYRAGDIITLDRGNK